MPSRGTIGTVLTLGAVAAIVAGLILFGVTRTYQDPGFTPDPIDTILAQGDPVTWCEGFAAGVILLTSAHSTTPFTFPTREVYDVSIVDCVERHLADVAIPFGETR